MTMNVNGIVEKYRIVLEKSLLKATSYTLEEIIPWRIIHQAAVPSRRIPLYIYICFSIQIF
ncbi:MAG: hypothetical protein PHF18_09010 [Methanosarcina sp.]|uniref:hypothetical protein n=1 Tax=Methanosarcina sp. TaxID=2213 RepID=UPI0026283536|nr:hypothetical protein [Methanosarcina sp.]MDD3246972.1 hypothetical protein [Methanosarcina sp.]